MTHVDKLNSDVTPPIGVDCSDVHEGVKKLKYFSVCSSCKMMLLVLLTSFRQQCDFRMVSSLPHSMSVLRDRHDSDAVKRLLSSMCYAL